MLPTEVLKRVSIFAGLSQEELQQVAALSRPVQYNRGDVILQEGEASNELYVIGKGMVEILVGAGDQDARPVLNLGTGQVFGEMALVDRGARSATVRAMTNETVLYAIPSDALLRLCEENTHIGFVMMRNLAAELSLKIRLRNIADRMGAG